MDLLFVLGLVGFFLGLILSIALHEIGHLVPAKAFGIKVTQYMVGFGNTLWSVRRGETEYGIKSIPLGGYIRMIGMFPPARGEDSQRVRASSTGPLQTLIEDARRTALLEVAPQDAHRVFYAKPWWQRVVVMLGGPFMNLVIAAVLFTVLLSGFGAPVPTTTLSSVASCIVPVTEAGRECLPQDPVTPAAAAGFRPGDRVIAFDGQPISTWDDLRDRIRVSAERAVLVVVERDGREVELTATLATSQRPEHASDPCSDLVAVGFLGVSPTEDIVRQGPVAVAGSIGGFLARTTNAVIGIPEKIVGVAKAAFGGERDVCGPVGVVGAGRLGGEIASLDGVGAAQRVEAFLYLLASFNMALFVFNLVPLLPLDGGHVAGALWEAVKKGWARLRRRPDPGPVDVARALPLAYGAASVLITLSVLLLYADLVNPVRIGG